MEHGPRDNDTRRSLQAGDPSRQARPSVPTGRNAALLGLQRKAGNAAVSRLVQSRRSSPPGATAAAPVTTEAGAGAIATIVDTEIGVQRTCAPPAAPPATPPAADPTFRAFTGRARSAARRSAAHPPPATEARAAQVAAQAPPNHRSSQAEAAKVDEMGRARPATFDKAAFTAAVRQQVEAAAPSNLDEVENFSSSGRAGQIKGAVSGEVDRGQDRSAGPVEEAANRAPDGSRARDKVTREAPIRSAGSPPASVGATGAVPKPAPRASTNLDGGPCSVDEQMAEAEVTDEQLANSNEPEFNAALEGKQRVEEQARTEPQRFRAEESARLGEERAAAAPLERDTLGQMHGSRAQGLSGAAGSQRVATSVDERKRREVANRIQAIYNRTKADVDRTLSGLDGKVQSRFDAGERAARQAFESYVSAQMRAYKRRRYSGVLGAGRWLKDKFLGLPAAVNAFYDAGKRRYIAAMDRVISAVADIIGRELDRAADRIRQGKAEIDRYVQSLPRDLRGVGQEASRQIGARFDQLEQDIAAKNQAMVQLVAERYIAARRGLDERIEQMQAENRGLLSGVLDAIGSVIRTILEMKALLMNVLAAVSGVVGKILANPVQFVGKLASAIGAGLAAFASNIGTHLKNGLITWLTGTLGEGGIQLPGRWDLKGIIQLVLQILGLTWANIRQRLIAKVGAKAVAALESGFTLIRTVVTQGLGGLGRWFISQVGNIKTMVFDAIKGFLIESVVKKGIEWVISLLTPAGAFVQAVRAIVSIVQFFIEKASMVGGLLNSVMDAVSKVASGAFGAVSAAIETTLARALPVAIGFLANLLGLGGLARKVQDIIGTVRSPINRAIDFLIDKAVGWVRSVWKGANGGNRSPKQRDGDLSKGLNAGVRAVNALPGSRIGRAAMVPVLGAIRMRYRLSSLQPVERGTTWWVEGTVQRAKQKTRKRVDPGVATVGTDLKADGQTGLLKLDGPLPSYDAVRGLPPRRRAEFIRALTTSIENRREEQRLGLFPGPPEPGHVDRYRQEKRLLEHARSLR